MASNPLCFKKFEITKHWNNPVEVNAILTKRDIRGGYDLGRQKEVKYPIVSVDLQNKDRIYWKSIFNAIWNTRSKWSITHREVVTVICNIRNIRYKERLPRAQSFEERYGYMVVQWARAIVADEIDDYCKDNFRLARKGDRRALKAYKKQKDHGCCGYFDVIRRCPYDWFRKYHIGCNYGH